MPSSQRHAGPRRHAAHPPPRNAGGVELILEKPLHPNLRLRWRENLGMVANLVSRVLFIALVAGALSMHAFEFSWWWSLPPVVSVLLNLRIATSMQGWTARDVLYALVFVAAVSVGALPGILALILFNIGVVAKLLHQPTVVLKDAAGSSRGDRLVAALRELFEIEGQDAP